MKISIREQCVGLATLVVVIMAAFALEVRAIPRVVTKTIKETDRQQKFEVSARYPQISGTAFAKNFNALAERLVRSHIGDFRRDLYPPEGEDCMRGIDIVFKTEYLNTRVISVGFGAGTDACGAHPNSFSFVLNYDLKKGQELSLSDLFRPGSNYLAIISSYCIRQLGRRGVGDAEWIREGAGPSSNNYRSWVIRKGGLLMTFDAYRVASYAEGPQSVLVPYSVIKSMTSANGPLSGLAK